MKKTKLSPSDKGFIVAGISLVLGAITGFSLIITSALAGPSGQAPIVIILGPITIVLSSIGVLLGCVLQINFRSHEKNNLKSDLQDERDRLLHILNDQEA